MNVLQVLGQEGHTTVEWDPDDADQVGRARAEFDKLRDAGFLLFTVERERSQFEAGDGLLEARLVSAPATVSATAPEPGTKPRGRLRKSEQTREFDPTAKETVAVRPMRGG